MRAHLAEPLWRQFSWVAAWMFGDLVSGTTRWMFKTSWQFAALTTGMQFTLFVWIALSLAAGVLSYDALQAWLAPYWALGLAAAVALALFMVLRLLAWHMFVISYNNSWPHLRALGRGEPRHLQRPIDASAARLKALVEANDAEEIVVAGHCYGGPLVLWSVARALDIDPDLAGRGPRIVMLTLASIVPAVAIHPSAAKMRAIIRRLATESSITWIDCQSRTDAMNFPNFDPVAGVGIDAGSARCNPLIWQVRFRDMLPDRDVRRMRAKLLRLHFQFIMPNVYRAPYDYFMPVCGPIAVPDWARSQHALLAHISAHGELLGPS